MGGGCLGYDPNTVVLLVVLLWSNHTILVVTRTPEAKALLDNGTAVTKPCR
jgi:hypothetical protein